MIHFDSNLIYPNELQDPKSNDRKIQHLSVPQSAYVDRQIASRVFVIIHHHNIILSLLEDGPRAR